jgi:hypothetical protein
MSSGYQRLILRALALASIAWAIGVVTSCAIRLNWPRHELEVAIVPAGAMATSDAPGRVKWMDANGRSAVSIERAWITYDRAEIISCADYERPTLPGFGWRELLIPSAHAHGPTTPTRLGQQHVVDLFAGDSIAWGRLAPYPETYCAIRVGVAAAKQGAAQLWAAPQMLGKSMRVQGTRHHPDGTTTPFELSSAASFDVTLIFERPRDFDTEEAIVAPILIEQRLEAWFINDEATETEQARDMLMRTRDGLQITVEEGALP